MTSENGQRTPRQAWSEARRRYAAMRAAPTLTQRLAAGAIFIVVVGLVAIVLVSSLVVGAVVVAIGAAAFGISALVRRLRSGGSGDQGRRNVRVIVRQQP